MEFITFIYVRDLKASLEFYSSILGLQEVLNQQSACKILKVNDGAYIGICQEPSPISSHEQKDEPKLILTLVTDDVELYYKRFLKAKVATESEPQINEKFQIFHFFVHDPDGYLIEVQRFLDPRWESR